MSCHLSLVALFTLPESLTRTFHTPSAIGEIVDVKSCDRIVLGCLAGCVVICAAATFGYFLCLSICVAACWALNAGCMNDAEGDYNFCIAAADAKRMACDPGWTPTVVN